MRALVLEDDPRLRGVVARTAGRAGLAVDEATSIEEADELLGLHQYDLLVLDRRLPDGDGLDVCRAVRARGFGNAILMLTALDDSESVVDGLAGGADDYVGKPFDLDVLEARMKVLLRRNPHPPTLELKVGDLTMRPWMRRLTANDTDVPLTAREFAVMQALMREANGAVSREELLEQAWGEREEPMSNTIDVLIARIRRKLAAAGSLARIETLRGSGYRLSVG